MALFFVPSVFCRTSEASNIFKIEVVMAYFMFLLLRPCRKPRDQKTSFHQYSWNSKVKTTWISLIGWPHKKSNIYLLTSLYCLWKPFPPSFYMPLPLNLFYISFSNYNVLLMAIYKVCIAKQSPGTVPSPIATRIVF